ncbi:hypothetical protein LTS10_007637 [Elasticomyces elasticus]|nr:hypothetical protein LTS10_007637 [Elasticomyces elasticus]
MEATDERDLVYAILGLLARPSSPQNAIIPDYSKAPTTVLCEATALNITERQSLDPLTFSATDLNSDLPSWMPNARQGKVGIFLNVATHFYNAAGSTHPCLHWSCDFTVLHALGVVVDTVAEVVVEKKGTMSRSKQFAYNTGKRHGLSTRETRDRFWRTSIGNQARSYRNTIVLYPAPEDYGTRYMVSQKEMEMPSELVGDGEAFDWELEYIKPFYASLFDENGHPRFFTTVAGRFGTGQTGVAPGDLLCILSGGRVVYILREIAGHQRLVGCAYLHGVMDGELSSQLNDEKVVRHFEIH